ncbi:hypothetical protein ASF08_22820 [Methylobacterium sp. Leaf85]|nr:hypothetical protein ASF08_22820 [Methylobacterium sp. Leaf85]
MPTLSVDFGYYPGHLTIQSGPISIETLPDLEGIVRETKAEETVDGDWFYAPPQQVRHFPSGTITNFPYASRVFGLPKTHRLNHSAADNSDHLVFVLWVLSFFVGMRLTSTEAGFLDSTPLRPGKLVDFVLFGRGLDCSLVLAENFWLVHKANPEQARRFAAATHALFLAQHRQHLQFERFLLLYTALDACFALATASNTPPPRLGYARRIEWMCGLFGMAVPAWADPNAPGGAEAAFIRNATVHEALFMGEPLGFAVHDASPNLNLPLEMKALLCRFLVALLGASKTDYVRSPVNTRQRQPLTLL